MSFCLLFTYRAILGRFAHTPTPEVDWESPHESASPRRKFQCRKPSEVLVSVILRPLREGANKGVAANLTKRCLLEIGGYGIPCQHKLNVKQNVRQTAFICIFSP